MSLDSAPGANEGYLGTLERRKSDVRVSSVINLTTPCIISLDDNRRQA